MDIAQRIAAVYAYVKEHCHALPAPVPAYVLVFSVCDGSTRARTLHSTGKSFDQAWKSGLVRLRADMRRAKITGQWLRVDWVAHAQPMEWRMFTEQVATTRRNYFRFGVALDALFTELYTEQECNANAVFYSGGQTAQGCVNEKNFSVYARKRYAKPTSFPLPKDAVVWKVATAGVFCDTDGSLHALDAPNQQDGGRDTGHRSFGQPTPEFLTEVVQRGAGWLARQIGADGKFVYGTFPCFNREIGTYNTLRHTSSLYALLESWEYLCDDSLRAPIERALRRLCQRYIRTYTLADGSTAAWLKDTGGELKLGGSGVCLLALVKWAECTGSTEYDDLMRQLAHGIERMWHDDLGRFDHVWNADDLQCKEAFRIVYYDGEALFGLLRLYGLRKEKRWLDIARKAFEAFIQDDHWKAHDHWLSYCTNELLLHCPDERYLRFGMQNIKGYLNFILTRETTYPTLVELSMAAQAMFARLGCLPQYASVLHDFDMDTFQKALHYRASYVLNGVFWPEMAMFFGCPERIVYSFFIRHHAFRARIDDAEHYLSGLIAYAKYIATPEGKAALDRVYASLSRQLAATRQADVDAGNILHPDDVPTATFAAQGDERMGTAWTADDLVQVTGGRWIRKPPAHWLAHGCCCICSQMAVGRLLVTVGDAPTKETRGFAPAALSGMLNDASGIIAQLPFDASRFDVPCLGVSDEKMAIRALGSAVRNRYTGTVIGVTGTSGKTTTVGMLAHVLQRDGLVGQTSENGNLPHGVAWNLCNMPPAAPYWVVELGVGRIHQSTRMCRPHIALVLNVSDAHLIYWGNTENIARQKARIFESMESGAWAVMNADMAYYAVFAEAAAQKGLRVFTFGESDGVDAQLLEYTGATCTCRLGTQLYRFSLPMCGRHTALNALAVLACTHVCGADVSSAVALLPSYVSEKGRGRILRGVYRGKDITVVDEAYNCNPASMRAALGAFADRATGRRVCILGDMLELGAASLQCHLGLKDAIAAVQPDCLLLCGEYMGALWRELCQRYPGAHYDTAELLLHDIDRWLESGDSILIKSSNGTGLHTLVSHLESSMQPQV